MNKPLLAAMTLLALAGTAHAEPYRGNAAPGAMNRGPEADYFNRAINPYSMDADPPICNRACQEHLKELRAGDALAQPLPDMRPLYVQAAEREPPACDDPDVMGMLQGLMGAPWTITQHQHIGFSEVLSRNADVEPYHVRWCSAVAEGPGLRQRKQYTVEWMRERKSAMLPGGPIRTPDGTMWVQLRGAP
jgi:hypothetical protein